MSDEEREGKGRQAWKGGKNMSGEGKYHEKRQVEEEDEGI